MIEQLLDFIDNLSVDEQLYWRVPATEGALLEVMWKRGSRKAAWSIRPLGSAEWQAMPAKDLLARISAMQGDVAAFERQVGVSVLTQAVFADMVLEAAHKIFGVDAVQRSISDTKNFLASVTEVAQKHTRTEAVRPRLKLVSK